MDKSLHGMITHALKGELQAVDFYLALAAATVNTEVQTLAHRFAAEEQRHCQVLLDWLEQDENPALQAALQEVGLFGGNPLRQVTITRKGTEKPNLVEVADPLRALELAIAQEVESIMYFLDLQQQVEEPFGRQLLTRMCQDEQEHKLFLKEQYLTLRRMGC